MAIGVSDWAADHAGEAALVDGSHELSWKELDETLNRAVNALRSCDLGPRRRVAVFAENAAPTVVAHLAAVLAGASSVPVSFHLTADEVAYVLDDSQAAVLFVGPETAERGIEAAARAGVPAVVTWGPAAAGALPWREWLDAASPDEPADDVAPLPHLHYTSGTTGVPKGTETPPAMFAGGATMAEHVAAVRRNPVLREGGTVLVVGPLYHTGPLASVRGLLNGMRLVVMGRFDAEQVLAAIEAHRVDTTVMVPTHFQRLLALPDEVRARYDVSSLRLVAHTGAACPVEVKRAMIEWFGPVLFEAYGGTEAGTTNAITSQEWLAHPGSVGRAVPPFEVLVVDDDGTPLGPGDVGRVYFRDTTGRGVVFHNDPEKTAAAHLEPGVFTLGEVGYVDDDGYLYITDRFSDMVVSGGVNVYPAEAEQVLLEAPGVADVACIGVPHDDLGEQLLALVVPADPSSPPSAEDLVEFCRERIAHYKAPGLVELVDDLGRNAMGKLNKRALRAPYWPTERTIAGG